MRAVKLDFREVAFRNARPTCLLLAFAQARPALRAFTSEVNTRWYVPLVSTAAT